MTMESQNMRSNLVQTSIRRFYANLKSISHLIGQVAVLPKTQTEGPILGQLGVSFHLTSRALIPLLSRPKRDATTINHLNRNNSIV